MNPQLARRLGLSAFGIILAGLVLALAAISWLALVEVERRLVPEMEKKAATIGRSLAGLVGQANAHGIPLAKLNGMDELFGNVLANNPEIGGITLTGPAGAVLFAQGATPQAETGHVVLLDIPTPGTDIGQLRIGLDEAYVQNALREIVFDVLIVLVVALFLTIELLHFMAGATVIGGVSAITELVAEGASGRFVHRIRSTSRDEIGRVLVKLDGAVGRLNERFQALSARASQAVGAAGEAARDNLASLSGRFSFGTESAGVRKDGRVPLIRAPLFLFILAEELTRAFMPLYAKQLYAPIPGLSNELVIGLPVIVFMLIFALFQPSLGAFSERVGRRRSMMMGAVLASVGIVATAFAASVHDLLIWRSITAFGYTLVFIAAQGFVLDHTTAQSRGWGVAIFINAIMVAGVCGPSIGGILADRVGLSATFGVAAVLVLLSIVAMWRNLPEEPASYAPPVKLKLSHFRVLLKNRRLLLLLLACSMPAKLILSAFCFYLLPIYLNEIGASQATTGRMMMLYAIIMIFVVPLAARLADRFKMRASFVAYGGILSGLGGMSILISDQFGMVVVIVATLGLSQAIGVASQSALVGELGRREGAVIGESVLYGMFRLIERAGAAIGPMLGALLLAQYGFVVAMAAVSGFVLLGGIAFALSTRGEHKGRIEPDGASIVA